MDDEEEDSERVSELKKQLEDCRNELSEVYEQVMSSIKSSLPILIFKKGSIDDCKLSEAFGSWALYIFQQELD